MPRTPSEKITKGGSYSDSIGPSPGWRTKTHKRYISKDYTLLRELETAARGDDRQSMRLFQSLRKSKNNELQNFGRLLLFVGIFAPVLQI